MSRYLRKTLSDAVLVNAGKMVRVQSGSETEGTLSDGGGSGGGVAVAQEEAATTFPPTYMVLVCSSTISNEAFMWLVDKIRGKRRDGGAELLVRRQPHQPGEGVTLHVSASKIKLLELAEELELKKRDREGLVREFAVAQLEEFLADGMHVDDLLTMGERQHIVRHELENIRALAEDDHVPGHAGLGLYEGQSIVQACQHWGLLEQMFPLHDSETLDNFGRKWYWALFRKQPIEEIRLYFGEAVALYFSFLGFYTAALIVPMMLGFLQLFVSSGTVAFFCMFNVLWVTVFLEVWKRKCSELAFSWGTIDMTSLDDDPRPNFHGHMAVDPVTGRFQPQFPRWKTNARMYLVSLPIVVLCMAGAFFVMLASFWAEEYLTQVRRTRGLRGGAVLVLAPSVLYTALVFVMNVYYRRLATMLTEWENHRTQTQFDRHRVTKLVLFEFVNNFMSLFYIAFYIQDMAMLKFQLAIMLIVLQAIQNFQEALLPLLIKYYGNMDESVSPREARAELKRRLRAQVMQCLSCLSPGRLLGWERVGAGEGAEAPLVKKAAAAAASGLSPADKEDQLQRLLAAVPALDADDPRIEPTLWEMQMEVYEGTYDDYLEMFVQFGYVILFSSVYPMAAFWAVVNNVLEIRSDAFKLCRVFQRPMAKRVKDIGAWQRAFEALGAMSVMTNCGLLCISPELRHIRPDVGAVEWVLFFVFLEHVLLVTRHVLHKAIPERPEWVRVALARINYQSKRALKNEVRDVVTVQPPTPSPAPSPPPSATPSPPHTPASSRSATPSPVPPFSGDSELFTFTAKPYRSPLPHDALNATVQSRHPTKMVKFLVPPKPKKGSSIDTSLSDHLLYPNSDPNSRSPSPSPMHSPLPATPVSGSPPRTPPIPISSLPPYTYGTSSSQVSTCAEEPFDSQLSEHDTHSPAVLNSPLENGVQTIIDGEPSESISALTLTSMLSEPSVKTPSISLPTGNVQSDADIITSEDVPTGTEEDAALSGNEPLSPSSLKDLAQVDTSSYSDIIPRYQSSSLPSAASPESDDLTSSFLIIPSTTVDDEVHPSSIPSDYLSTKITTSETGESLLPQEEILSDTFVLPSTERTHSSPIPTSSQTEELASSVNDPKTSTNSPQSSSFPPPSLHFEDVSTSPDTVRPPSPPIAKIPSLNQSPMSSPESSNASELERRRVNLVKVSVAKVQELLPPTPPPTPCTPPPSPMVRMRARARLVSRLVQHFEGRDAKADGAGPGDTNEAYPLA